VTPRLKIVTLAAALVVSCAGGAHQPAPGNADPDPGSQEQQEPATFADDLEFLRKHQEVIVLSDPETSAQILVCPGYQGRVMTSTATGHRGRSFGWLNYDLIASGQVQEHINAYGGEDRIWLGPEGGQFSIFFEPGAAFEFEHWQTPRPLDTEPFQVVGKSDTTAFFRRDMTLTSYAGTRFSLQLVRTVSVISRSRLEALFETKLADTVSSVSFETENQITNKGADSWTRETGALSIWILGMLKPSPSVTVAIPFKQGSESELGPVVTQDYFGAIPRDRLLEHDGVVYFKADGLYRSKIGIPARRALPIAGSYDAESGVLTIVQFSLPDQRTDYLRSTWELHDDPYSGDVVNSYNDGPLEDGGQLGPFYELESSSPAAFLAPGASLTHVHRTSHFEGPAADLETIARKLLGVGIQDIESAL